MPSQDLMRAVQLARAGEKDAARRILLRLVQQEPTDEMAWIWLVDTMPSDAQRVATLKQCLKHLPGSEHARKALAILQARQPSPPDTTSETAAQPEPAAAVAIEMAPETQPAQPEEIQPIGLDTLRELSSQTAADFSGREEPAVLEERETEPAFEWRMVAPTPPAPSRAVEDAQAAQPPIDSRTLTDLRSQLDKPPAAAPLETVKAAVQAVEVNHSAVSPLTLVLIALLVILAGLVGYMLFFSPLSPLRQAAILLPGTPTVETATTQAQTAVTQDVATLAATEEVTLTPAEEEAAPTPMPPGIYLSGSQVYSVDWSRDGAYFVVSSTGGVSLYDPITFNTLRFLDVSGSPTECRFSPDVERLVCAGAELRVWKISDWSPELRQTPTTLSEEGWIRRFEFLDAQTLGLLLVNDPIGVNYWSFEVLGTTGERLRAPENIRRLVVAQQGGRLAAGLENGEVIVWNLDTREAIFQQPVSLQPVEMLALSADGSRLVTVTAATIRIWDVASGEQQIEIDAGVPLSALALSADGESLAAAGEDGGLTFWEPATGEILDRREAGGKVAELLFAPDGQALAALQLDGNLFFYYGWR